MTRRQTNNPDEQTLGQREFCFAMKQASPRKLLFLFWKLYNEKGVSPYQYSAEEG